MKTACLLAALLTIRLTAADPPDLAKARETYERASKSALMPVKAAYWKELTRMIDEYTKAGKLEEALAVRTELTKLTGGTAAPLPATTVKLNATEISQLRDRFVGRTFVTPGGTHFTFNKDGSGTQKWDQGSDTFKWEVLDAKTVHAKLAQKQYYFWFESRFKGELADTLEATRRPVKVKE